MGFTYLRLGQRYKIPRCDQIHAHWFKTEDKAWPAKAMATPFARMLYGKISEQYDTVRPGYLSLVIFDVGVIQSCTYPGTSSNAIEQENHGNDCTSGSCVASLTVYSGAGSPYGESDQHAKPSDQEQLSAAELVDRESHTDSYEERPQLETAVDQRLIVRAGNADRVKNVVDVVRDKPVARALREESRQNDQEHSLSVSWSAE